MEDKNKIEVSIVMPCLNEAETIGVCVSKAKRFLERNGIAGEVIVADNGSTDGSPEIAKSLGARIVHVSERGYGAALIGGITASQGKYIIMGDSDDSHDLENLEGFIEKLRAGNELVVGNRFASDMEKGTMSFLNKYIGNPLLSGIGRILFKSPVKDFHCGLRGFTRELFDKLDLRTVGMEFASEMIVKATLAKARIAEVPTKMFPAGRSRKPHLRPFRDGWRHLRFLLLYSPRWLFFYPGLTMILIGLAISLWLLPGMQLSLDIHTMLYASTAIVIGLQSVSFAIFSKFFAMNEKLLPENQKLKKILSYFTLERGVVVGSIFIIAGLAGSIYSVVLVGEGIFNVLGITTTMRIVIVSTTALLIGFQVIFSSFFFSILQLKLKH